MESITLKGFLLHIGSQLLENESHLMAVDIMLNAIKKIKEETGYVAEEFNLGGGFGIQYMSDTETRNCHILLTL